MIDGEKIDDVTTHSMFKPIMDIRARIYDLAHEPDTANVMSYVDQESGEKCAVGSKPLIIKEDWRAKRTAVHIALDDVVTRVGDEMWSLFDGQGVRTRRTKT